MSTDELSQKRHEVLFRLRLAVRYHQRRVRFFDACDLWTKGLSVMAGTAVVGALWKQYPDAAAWATGLITAATTMALVFGYSTKSRQHSDLTRKYLDLEAKVVSEPNGTEEFICKVDGDIRLLESQEPPPLGALVVICQNELARQDGQEQYIVSLPTHQRLLAHFFDFEAPRPS